MANSDGREVRRQSHDSPLKETAKDGRTKVDAPPPKPSTLNRIRDALGLNVGMLELMLKGALPPTISLAAYQSTSFARTFSTLGYLVAIASVLSLAILPRSKFFQTLLLNILGLCFGASVALLSIYCSVQARAHTTPSRAPTSSGSSPGTGGVGYNSSASAVSAIWLFFNIYFVNTLRASRPQFQIPVIVYSIFANVALTYAPSFPNMAVGISFAKRLLETFLTGFAIATGVSLFIFPLTVRMGFFKQAAGFIGAVQSALSVQKDYLQSLEKEDMFHAPQQVEHEHHHSILGKSHKVTQSNSVLTPEHERLQAAVRGLGELYGRIYADIPFAKRETAYDKLNASDIDELFKHFSGLLLPLIGMSSAADIFQRIAENWGWAQAEGTISSSEYPQKEGSAQAKSQWNEIMKALHEPLQALTEVMHDGLQHTLLTLELIKPPKSKDKKNGRMYNSLQRDVERDAERDAGVMRPGDVGFAAHLASRVDGFQKQRETTLTAFCRQGGIKTEANPFANLSHPTPTPKMEGQFLAHNSEPHHRNKRQLYLTLYVSSIIQVHLILHRSICSLKKGT